RAEIDSHTKHLKVSHLRLSDAGDYTCRWDGSPTVTISLHVIELTISSEGHCLPDESLVLTLNSSLSLPDLKITLFNSHGDTVRPELSPHKSHRSYIMELKELKARDSGTWKCHVHSASPFINQNISFDVKVLGFQTPAFKREYATVDGTITLSWHLNFQQITWRKAFTGHLNWKQTQSASTQELLGFKVTEQGEKHETIKSSHFQLELPESKTQSAIEVKLPRIHVNYSGHYQCQLAYNGRYVQSTIELLVMEASANPVGPLLRGTEMILTCQVLSSLPPNAYLRWERVNGTVKDIKESKQHEGKVEVTISAAGLWNCHLIEGNDIKISLKYLVEEAPTWMSYVVTGASIAGSVLLFGLACLCIIHGVRWQRRRQRAKRMAQARQHLLENKTCQCEQ
ncbi:CD4 protein, partial [Bucco capensis]|nr:CD4 protein [Bucco capensis]